MFAKTNEISLENAEEPPFHLCNKVKIYLEELGGEIDGVTFYVTNCIPLMIQDVFIGNNYYSAYPELEPYRSKPKKGKLDIKGYCKHYEIEEDAAIDHIKENFNN